MSKTVNRVCFILSFLIGLGASLYTSIVLRISLWGEFSLLTHVLFVIFSAFLAGFLGLFVGPFIIKEILFTLSWSEGRLRKASAQDIIAGVVGLIIGLIIANLFSIPVSKIPAVGAILPSVLSLVIGYLGAVAAITKKEDILNLFSLRSRFFKDKERAQIFSQPKILDTSVIIDGRIADVFKTGFLEGPVLIPGFILDELQHIADSSDALKRNRGRRGLDIVNILQRESNVPIQISDKDPGGADVDSKLVKMGKNLNAKIITNDYNLNKVAEIKGVTVLNINELANAMKPVVLPGEEISVYVVKDGKESGQGVAYLDDGTMIVIDGGKKHIGDTIGVMVTSVLQTAAGRMIFAKPKNAERAIS